MAGSSLSASLSEAKYIPTMIMQLIIVGEESGSLSQTLEDISENYEQEINDSMKVITTLLEPIMIIVVGGIIGFIIIAMLLPIFQLDIFAQNDWKLPIYFTSGGFDGSMGFENYYQLEGLAYKVVPIHTPRESPLVMGRIDTEKMYDNVMNKFTWGRMNEPDVTLDYYTIRTLSVIRFRSLHTRLALELLEDGDTVRAVKVLDRCMELAPHNAVPYDRYIAGLTFPDGKGNTLHHEGVIEAYYMCGEKQKANVILKEYTDILTERMTYFQSLNQRLFENVQQEWYEVMAQLEELQVMLRKYGGSQGNLLDLEM